MRREIVHYETAQYADTYVPPSPDAVVKAWRNRESDVAHFVQLDQLKLAERLILRDLMFDHDRKLHSGKTDMDLESWMKRSMVGKLEKIIERLMKGMAADVVPFDFERWGPHPPILQRAASKVPFTFVDGILQPTDVRARFPRLWNWLSETTATGAVSV
jgi:hypothetical protein